MAEAKAPRAVQSNVVISIFGLTSLPVDILPARRSDDETKTKMVCSTCNDPSSLRQLYHCTSDDTHGPFSQSEVHRAVEVDGTLIKVTEDQLDILNTPEVPSGQAEFAVYDALEVERHTVQSGNVYRLRPRVQPELYHLIVDLFADRQKAYVCNLTMRNLTKMYRAIARDGMITLVELVRPGELHEIEIAPAEYPAQLLSQLQGFADSAVQPFNPDDWRNRKRDRAGELVELKRNPDAPKPEPVSASPTQNQDSLVALQALLEKSKPPARKKAAARKAPVKKASAKRAAKK